MKPSNPKRVFAVAGVVIAAACLWFFASSGSAPDEALLIRRMRATISLGWGWLHAKDMRVVAYEKKGEKYAVTFSYSVVIDRDEAALPLEERERFRRFLPMCSELPIAQGTACSLQEEMLFTKTKEYGWMPELFARFRPELLQAVADWKEPTP
ncbi:MAG: hypothetical protein LBC10_02400 [Deltaproteobacteria bacterium]|jgi:hypothetical protein|nr:hypothetical protein [Deltaproteobacteria bacterium]